MSKRTKEMHCKRILQTTSNPRLKCLLAPDRPLKVPKTKFDVILCLAHTAIHVAGAEIYGGFVRDWIVRGEVPIDIDVSVKNIESVRASMKRAAENIYKIVWKCTKQNERIGAASKDTYEFMTEEGKPLTVQVELVDSSKIQNSESPGVDCDVGNLIVGKSGIRVRYELHRKKVGIYESRIDRGVSLLDTIEHCLEKQFVLYYDDKRKDGNADYRKQKYQRKGWRQLLKHYKKTKFFNFKPVATTAIT